MVNNNQLTIKKAVILIGGVKPEFFPLSKVIPKSLFPLAEKPILHYLVQEAKLSGISQIIFVINREHEIIIDYFKRKPILEKILKDRKREDYLLELLNIQHLSQGISINWIFQEKPLGSGGTLLKTKEQIGDEPFAVLFCDAVIECKIPGLLQLINVFKTSQKPIVALSKIHNEKVDLYDFCELEKIANRIFKLKRILEKQKREKSNSHFAIIGRYILTPEIFDYLKKQKHNSKEQISLNNALEDFLKDGKIVYGYEIEGVELWCKNKLDWLKSHLYLSLKHPQFGQELKEFLKEIM